MIFRSGGLKFGLTTVFVLLISCLFFPSPTYATTSTLTLSITNSLSIDLVATTSAGNFVTSDTTTPNISITTNNGTGYTLGIKAGSSSANNNKLVNTNDSTKYFTSISSAVSENNYKDDTYAATNNLNNTWGYRPSKYNSANNSNYLPAPTDASNTTILDQTSAANPSTANEYNIAIGARADNTTKAGAYANSFIITAVANPTVYSITYNQNTIDTVTNMPTNASNQQTYSDTVTLSNLVPIRDGYNFKGWCTVQVADGASCTGTTYNPDGGGTNLNWIIDLTQSSASLTVYAMWEEKYNYCSDHGTELYCKVKAAWKVEGSRVMTNDADVDTGIKANITTSNSGVFKYNPSTFGASSDTANTSDIYFYRGILDNTAGSYGSNGDNEAHPNTVVLSSASSKSGLTTSDTCWRIVRTTGSGGVKMIYQGKWTGSTCANATTNAQVTTSAFDNTADSSGKSIIGVGYTYNASYKSTTSNTAYSTLFGSNTSYSGNSANSTMKNYLENTWFSSINSYARKLEPSAGWCNDRTIKTGETSASPVANDYSIKTPYTTASSDVTRYYFGAELRIMRWDLSYNYPSLTCPRGDADLYTASSASNGNKQLANPVALLTIDEAVFAGSISFSPANQSVYELYLRSGSEFWLLSPGSRGLSGYASATFMRRVGNLYNESVYNSKGVRPSISLISGTTAVSGSGTAADPWIVNPPQIISFKINNNTYSAEEGMTWDGWIDSSYNTGGYQRGSYGFDDIATNGGFSYVADYISDACGRTVHLSEEIVNSFNYGTRDYGAPC